MKTLETEFPNFSEKVIFPEKPYF